MNHKLKFSGINTIILFKTGFKLLFVFIVDSQRAYDTAKKPNFEHN